MKQTTLLKSWSNSQSQSNSNKKIQKSNDNPPTDIINLDSDEDPDDKLLAQAMEESLKLYQQQQQSIIQPSPLFNENTYSSPKNTNKASTSTFFQQKTTPIRMVDNHPVLAKAKLRHNFQPTSNDSANLSGFDSDAGKTWIYSMNFPVRDYQFKITQECLFRNTLVCLPTGLGKTFIASVVIYNFYRWYPGRKIIFMAPTRPLVTQQLEACYKVTGIPEECTIELTGSIHPDTRRKLWQEKRVFFLTPQVVVNDLISGTCLPEYFCCLVFDEAHRATGNYSYCQLIWQLTNRGNRQFRVLALTATPGSDLKTVQDVINNLLISHIELRNDNSADIQRYSFARNVEKVVVPLGKELTAFKSRLMKIVEGVINRLKMRKAIWPRQNASNLSKFMLIKQREEFFKGGQSNLTNVELGFVQRDFSVGTTLFHALELLQQHGLRPMFLFLDGVLKGEKGSFVAKQELGKIQDFADLWDELETRFRGNPDSSFNPMSTQAPFVGGHPKLIKLEEIIMSHFQQYKNMEDHSQTKVIIFSQFRDSVNEIMHLLKQKRPLIRPMCFIGQSSAGKNAKGYTQKDQMRVMQEFREGAYNTLVSTCIGEEGLDIGEVDLIICFDTQKSPIRMIQRMGRTGRKRQGKVIMLLTEGKEQQNYSTSLSKKSSVDKAIIDNCRQIKFYPDNPHMVPIGTHPQPLIQNIEVATRVGRPGKSRQSTLPGLVYSGKIPSKKSVGFQLTDEMIAHVTNVGIEDVKLLPLKRNKLISLSKEDNDHALGEDRSTAYNINKKYKENYLSMQETNLIGHSNVTFHFTSVCRLLEEHRRGKTCIMYHALGLRTVDMDDPLSQVATQPDPLSPIRIAQMSLSRVLGSDDEDFDVGLKTKKQKRSGEKSHNNNKTVTEVTTNKSRSAIEFASPVFGQSQAMTVTCDMTNLVDNLGSVFCFVNDHAYISGGVGEVFNPPSEIERNNLISDLIKEDFSLSQFDLLDFFQSFKSSKMPFSDSVLEIQNSDRVSPHESNSNDLQNISPVQQPFEQPILNFDALELIEINNIMHIAENEKNSFHASHEGDLSENSKEIIFSGRSNDCLSPVQCPSQNSFHFEITSTKIPHEKLLPSNLNRNESNISNIKNSNSCLKSNQIMFDQSMTPIKSKLLSCFDLNETTSNKIQGWLPTNDSVNGSDFDLSIEISESNAVNSPVNIDLGLTNQIDSNSQPVSPSFLGISKPLQPSNQAPDSIKSSSRIAPCNTSKFGMNDSVDAFLMLVDCDALMAETSGTDTSRTDFQKTSNNTTKPFSSNFQVDSSENFMLTQSGFSDSTQVSMTQAHKILDESNLMSAIKPTQKCINSSVVDACNDENTSGIPFNVTSNKVDVSLKNTSPIISNRVSISPNIFKTPLTVKTNKSAHNDHLAKVEVPAKNKLLSCFDVPETSINKSNSWIHSSFSDSIKIHDFNFGINTLETENGILSENQNSLETSCTDSPPTSPSILTTSKSKVRLITNPVQYDNLTCSTKDSRKRSRDIVYSFSTTKLDDCSKNTPKKRGVDINPRYKNKLGAAFETSNNIGSSQGFSLSQTESNLEEEFIRSSKKRKLNILSDTMLADTCEHLDDQDNDDFIERKKSIEKSPLVQKRKKKKSDVMKSLARPYFLSQAGFSTDEEQSSENENSQQLDEYDASFVDDDNEDESSDMKQVYLQSVRSPVQGARSGGGFLIRPLQPIGEMDWIYSQNPMLETQENTYLKDSFCVSSSADEPSPLRPKKSKKRQLKTSGTRRKRVRCQDTSSSQHNSSSEDFL